MSGFLDGLVNLSPVLVYLVVAALVFAEDALFVGFAIPGETAAVLGGVSAYLGRTDVAVMAAVVVVAAVVGDSVGYEVGRHLLGPRLEHGRWAEKHRDRIDSTQDLLRRRGGVAVLLGRFTAVLRALMPAMAGASRLPYRTFLPWNAVGGLVWGIGFVLLGYLAGSSYHAVEHQVGRVSGLVLGALVVAALVVWRVRRRRQAPQASSQPSMSEAGREAGPV